MYAVVFPVKDPPPGWEPDPALRRAGVRVTAAVYAPPGYGEGPWWETIRVPLGKGPAVRAGASHVVDCGEFSRAAFVDTGAYSASDILRVLESPAPVAVAQRSVSGHSSPWRKAVHRAVKGMVPPRGCDTQSPLKSFRISLLAELLAVEPDLFRGAYEFDLRVFRALSRWGVEIERIPLDEARGSGGPSGVRPRHYLSAAKAVLFPDPVPPRIRGMD